MQNFETKTLFIIKNMNMGRVKLTENELNRIITESINKLLNEREFFDDDAYYRNKLRKQGVSAKDIKNAEKNNKWSAVQRDRNGNLSAIPKGDKSSNWDNAKPVKPEDLEEGVEDEGLFNRLRSAAQGAKQGYQAQKTLDRGTDDFKQQHDYGDMIHTFDNPLSKMPNTAEEQAAEIYRQYKQYYMKANELLALYNKICRKYGLQKQGVGDFKSTVKGPSSSGVDFKGGMASAGKGMNAFGRQHTATRNPQHGTFWEEEE